jgi:3'5'-cyclic nucleotide phosphodiesterase
MIATSSPIALRYNDISVLESYHCSKGFEIMYSDDAYNVLGALPIEKQKELRQSICSMVLKQLMTGTCDRYGQSL